MVPSVIPSHFRPFTISFVSIFWNWYLNLVQHRDICVIVEDIENESRRQSANDNITLRVIVLYVESAFQQGLIRGIHTDCGDWKRVTSN